MNRAKARKAQLQLHDAAVQFRTAHTCGRTIASTNAVADTLDILERLVAALLENEVAS